MARLSDPFDWLTTNNGLPRINAIFFPTTKNDRLRLSCPLAFSFVLPFVLPLSPALAEGHLLGRTNNHRSAHSKTINLQNHARRMCFFEFSLFAYVGPVVSANTRLSMNTWLPTEEVLPHYRIALTRNLLEGMSPYEHTSHDRLRSLSPRGLLLLPLVKRRSHLGLKRTRQAIAHYTHSRAGVSSSYYLVQQGTPLDRAIKLPYVQSERPGTDPNCEQSTRRGARSACSIKLKHALPYLLHPRDVAQ